jgi:tetrahydromethanopterin S-methyltransferase subunit G
VTLSEPTWNEARRDILTRLQCVEETTQMLNQRINRLFQVGAVLLTTVIGILITTLVNLLVQKGAP